MVEVEIWLGSTTLYALNVVEIAQVLSIQADAIYIKKIVWLISISIHW